jgi:hypothetical protein
MASLLQLQAVDAIQPDPGQRWLTLTAVWSRPSPPAPVFGNQRGSGKAMNSTAGLPERNPWRAGSPAVLPVPRHLESPVFAGAGAGVGVH